MMTNVPSHGYAGLYAREGLYASKPPDFAGVYAESRDFADNLPHRARKFGAIALYGR